MADLNDTQASGSTKIVGSDSSGTEQTPVKSSPNGDLSTSDIINNNGLEGVLTVGTSAIEVKVGASRLANRKIVTLYNNSSSTIYWGFTSGVTISSGSPIEKNEFIVWSVGPDLPIYVIANSAGNNTRVTEGS